METFNRQHMQSNVVQHETTHQWTGDSVTNWDWTDLWLNEGWTLFYEYEYSGASSDAQLAQACRSGSATGGPAGNPNPNAFAEYHVYACGARALRDLRGQMGTQRFNEMAKGWQEHKKYQNATRADFVAWVKQSAGMDPTRTLDQWLGAPPA